MNEETANRLKSLEEKLGHMWRYLDLPSKIKEISELEKVMEESAFWEDSDKAQKTIAECNKLKSWTEPYHMLKTSFEDVQSLLPDADEDPELVTELMDELTRVEKGVEELEIKRMLSGELDEKNCYITLNAGAGGTESCDWVAMLTRMYQRWFTLKRFKWELIDQVDGEVAGIKSITMSVTGPFAYGYAKAEKGVHRLVRISPFDSNARRHTSFAAVEVTPQIEDDIAIEIRPDDIRIDTYRASGAGGQHVNKTESAVRITHLKTNIVVTCQAERSQLQNRETCMKMLRAKLYEREVMERQEALNKISGEKMENAWGAQIRSYVFQPYTLVKDTRTKYEEGNIESVMDGHIDGFINAYLKEFS
ncbi:MAG: peptide chain release factor 2 [Simkaniaceae bacterium]|nr:peptide chain release factor 2 [Simkaniaceae bacterium]